MTIQAIETRYKGYRFRSRLEAKWAVFFDTLGIEWEYEKEGYQLGPIKESNLYDEISKQEKFNHDFIFDSRDKIVRYLPDFYLPEFNCFIEIKGQTNQKIDMVKCSRLSFYTRKPVYVLNNIPEIIRKNKNKNNNYFGKCFVAGTFLDNTHYFCKCWLCGSIVIGPPNCVSKNNQLYTDLEIEKNNLLGYVSVGGCKCNQLNLVFFNQKGDEVNAPMYLIAESESICKAYDAARSARFEHGEVNGC